MKARALLLAALLGVAGAQTSVAPLPGLAAPTPVVPNTALLLDGQKLTIDVKFNPGAEGTAYPPLVPFSKSAPAYYPMLGTDQAFHLSVQSTLAGAALVLRTQPITAPGQQALPIDRIEYSVNGAPFVPSTSIQVIALLPVSGQATYDIALRLRLEGDEPAGLSQALLSWSVEAR
ncbi:hypothetical protein HNQ07_002396 [Deinococcus metalli]|uniref:DUF4402 domain-containing protein n=1 Tax=Deinococcus metalli TaxID=1141878 RepID=A0A7W8KEX9_9DEIO|nr:hypothetical protein [Deinococcus metalli]MBB5376932.1 hypothetical protein [Deinococcus metalli]GHF46401.1 hypothetical protein GCM10017781_23590 [Deinococcus metalli]